MVIDRFEGDYAVIETDDGGHINVLKSILPKEAKDGDIVLMENGEYLIDTENTELARKRAVELRDSLWNK